MVASWVLLAAACVLPIDESVQLEFIPSGATQKVGGYRPLRATMTSAADDVKVQPEGLVSPQYGEIELGSKKYLFIVDEPADGPAKLYVDTNADGDLTNDPETEWMAQPRGAFTMHMGSAKIDLGDGKTGSLGVYRFDPTDPSRANLKNTLLYYTDFGYEVTLMLDGKSHTTFISGSPENNMPVWVDRDGNNIRSSKREMLTIGKPFNFTGTTYVLQARNGELAMDVAAEPIEMMPLPPDLSVGKPAIPFKMTSLAGNEIDFPNDYKGKIVLLDFWATWCGPCIAELPNLKRAYADWHDQGFEVLGISFDNANMADKVKTFTEERAMPWPQIYEGKQWNTELGEMYDVSAIPFVLLVDGDTGEILATVRDLRGPGLSDFIGKVLTERKGSE